MADLAKPEGLSRREWADVQRVLHENGRDPARVDWCNTIRVATSKGYSNLCDYFIEVLYEDVESEKSLDTPDPTPVGFWRGTEERYRRCGSAVACRRRASRRLCSCMRSLGEVPGRVSILRKRKCPGITLSGTPAGPITWECRGVVCVETTMTTSKTALAEFRVGVGSGYIFPEGLFHYVKEHGVGAPSIPKDFQRWLIEHDPALIHGHTRLHNNLLLITSGCAGLRFST